MDRKIQAEYAWTWQGRDSNRLELMMLDGSRDGHVVWQSQPGRTRKHSRQGAAEATRMSRAECCRLSVSLGESPQLPMPRYLCRYPGCCNRRRR